VAVCPNCGAPLPSGARFCPQCAAPVAAQSAPEPGRVRRLEPWFFRIAVALLVALLVLIAVLVVTGLPTDSPGP
jgi:predicted amidophosphoribosyltransferase